MIVGWKLGVIVGFDGLNVGSNVGFEGLNVGYRVGESDGQAKLKDKDIQYLCAS